MNRHELQELFQKTSKSNDSESTQGDQLMARACQRVRSLAHL